MALWLLAGGLAHGDHEDSAKLHYEHGLSAYGLGHYAEAADEYEKAFALKPDPALLYNAAQSHRLAGTKSRALQLYKSYLALFGDVPNRVEVQRHIDELSAAIVADERLQSSPPVTPQPMATESPPVVATAPALQLAAAPPPPRRWYRRPWVWGVVAGGVVVVAGAVVLGATLGTTTHNPTPSFGSVTAR